VNIPSCTHLTLSNLRRCSRAVVLGTNFSYVNDKSRNHFIGALSVRLMCDLVDGTFRKKSTTIPVLKNGRDLSEFFLVHQVTFEQTLFDLQVLDFLDLEATLAFDSEEEEYEEEDEPGNWYGLSIHGDPYILYRLHRG